MIGFIKFYALCWTALALAIAWHDRRKIVHSYKCNRAATGRNPIICAAHAWFWYVSTFFY